MDKKTKELYNEYFKVFKRFLKDNGYYPFMKKYLFNDRTKSEFLKDVYDYLKKNKGVRFGDILHYVPILGKSYKQRGQDYWEAHVRKIDHKWIIYFINYEKNSKKYGYK